MNNEYADKFMSRAKQDIKICENEHELQMYIAGLLENIDYWKNEYDYMKKYRDTLQQENKQLKEEKNKHKNILKEIEKNITKIKTDIEPWTTYKVDGEILFNIQLEIDKFKELEKGDSNE